MNSFLFNKIKIKLEDLSFLINFVLAAFLHNIPHYTGLDPALNPQ